MRIVIALGIFICIELIAYFLSAYIMMDINPINWNIGIRIMQSVMGTMFAFLVTGLYLDTTE